MDSHPVEINIPPMNSPQLVFLHHVAQKNNKSITIY